MKWQVHLRANLIRARLQQIRATRCFTWNHLYGLGPDKTIHRERTSCLVRRKKIGLPVLLSIIYYAVSSDRSLPAAISNIRTNYTARTDARTRSEPVPAWCRCYDGTHFFLCIGYFRFHNTSDRFDTKRARNARPMCHLGGWNECETRRIPVNFIRAIVANKIPK